MTKLYKILPALILLVLLLASCGAEKHPEQPWKGYWYAVTSNPGGDGGNKLYVRLDFYDSTVCADGYENVLGVLTMTKDRSVYTPVAADLITSVDIQSPKEARINYIQQVTGQLRSGTLKRADDGSLTFVDGKMLRAGKPGMKDSPEGVYDVDPATLVFNKISDKPNYKEIPTYELVMTLPDRSYYLHALMTETEAPPFGDVQLRCYFPDTDRDINITNEVGDSPLNSRFHATIVDCWPLPGEPGLGLIIWSGGEDMQELTLYRVNDRNTFEAVDYVVGRRPDRYLGEQMPDSAAICSVVREGRLVKVRDPLRQETRVYDLAGNRR